MSTRIAKAHQPSLDKPAPAASRASRATIPWGSAIFPTERESDFKKFHDQVRRELAPEGLSQERVVLRVAQLRWRLDRFTIFRRADEARRNYARFLQEETLWLTLIEYGKFVFDDKMKHINRRIEKKKKQEEEKKKVKEGESPDPVPQQASCIEEKPISKDEESAPFLTLREVADSLMLQTEEIKRAFTEVTGEQLALQEKEEDGGDIELGYYADQLSVDNFIAELRIVETIEDTIDRNLDRLRRLKEEKQRSKERSRGRSTLLPPYGRRW
jgi:hypothetical protein